MMKGSLSALGSKLVLLAPQQNRIPKAFYNVTHDTPGHGSLLKGLQRLRGQVYRKEGAITESQMDQLGGFPMEADVESWHLLLLNHQSVLGCARLLLHPPSVMFDRLLIRNCPVAQTPLQGCDLRVAIESQIRLAGNLGFSYVELGGWALSEEIRGTSAALKCLSAMYAWAQLMGGCLGLCTATVRHGSASILSRIGGTPLGLGPDRFPPYFDPAYGCEMEILAFDSRTPRSKFASVVDLMRQELRDTPIIMCQSDPTQIPDSGNAKFLESLNQLRNAVAPRISLEVQSDSVLVVR